MYLLKQVDTLLGELENLTRQRTELLVAQRTQHEKLMAETRRRLRAERRLSALRERCGSAIEQLLSREAAIAAELHAAYELLAERAAAKGHSAAAGPTIHNVSASGSQAAPGVSATREPTGGRVAYSRDAASHRDSSAPSAHSDGNSVRGNTQHGPDGNRSVLTGVAAIGEGFGGNGGGDAEGGDMLGQSISIGDILHDGEDDDDSDAEVEQLLAPAASSQANIDTSDGAATVGRGEGSAGHQNGSSSPRHSPNDGDAAVDDVPRGGSAEDNSTAAPAQSVTAGAPLPVDSTVATAAPTAPNERAQSPHSSVVSPYTPFSGPPDATSNLQQQPKPVEQVGMQPSKGTQQQQQQQSQGTNQVLPHKDGPWPPSLTYTHHWTRGAPGTPEGERVLAQAAKATADYHAGVQRRQPAAQLAREHREMREQAFLAGRFPLEESLSLRKKPTSASSQAGRKQGRARRPASASAAQAHRRQFQDFSFARSQGQADSSRGVHSSGSSGGGGNPNDYVATRADFAAGASPNSRQQCRETSERSRAAPTARDAAIAAAIARDRARVAQKVSDTRNWHCGSLRAQHLNHATAGLARHPPMAVAGANNPYIPR